MYLIIQAVQNEWTHRLLLMNLLLGNDASSKQISHVNVSSPYIDLGFLESSLLQLTVTWDGILVMMGDFNNVREAGDHYGSVFNDRQAKFFNEFIEGASLIDISLGGFNYTWTDKDALKSLGDFARMEARDLSQNEKTKWTLEGDENTEFFHGTVKKRKHQLAIKGIMKNGVWIEEPGIVKAEFMSHFSHQFQQPTAFIKDRNILDGPLILNEVLAWYHQRKKKLMVFKVDFEKAFDYVHWDFLDLIMDKLGLDLKWCAWINGCLHNAHSSVLVNGFLRLHALISKAKALCLFKGASIGKDNMSISNLMYADDVIFFGEWSWINAHNLIRVGVTDEEVSYMVNIIGYGASKFPMKYLGVPVGCNMARRTPRGGVESTQFNSLKDTIGNIILTHQHDSWRWSLDVSKGFSVACVRQLVDSHILVIGNEATRWNRSLPIKVNVFLWRLKLNKLPSRVNLDRIGIEITSLLCLLCLGDFETINHFFFNCDMAKGLWSLFTKCGKSDLCSKTSYTRSKVNSKSMSKLKL
nr:RNA-directed DNA polymerase, eukaryota, reverse transcriptase zinc-binding domain protein [Tanacetum cinerariifolium]